MSTHIETKDFQSNKVSFDLIAGLVHHKTGTYQMDCIQKTLAKKGKFHRSSVNWPCTLDIKLTETAIETCLDTVPEAYRPGMFKANHGLEQVCLDNIHPCQTLVMQQSSVACTKNSLKEVAIESSKCTYPINTLSSHINFAVLHQIRNPIDVVISAYLFHRTLPSSEPWIVRDHWRRPKFKFALELYWQGASQEDLAHYGFEGIDTAIADDAPPDATFTDLIDSYQNSTAANEKVNYGDIISRLPLEHGILMEFWHSLPEVWSMARQYQLLEEQQKTVALQIRFEDLKLKFNETILNVLDQLNLQRMRPGLGKKVLLNAIVQGGCDPNAWSEEQRKRSSHITAGKGGDDKKKAEEILMAYPPAKEHLCKIAGILGYTDERCEPTS